MINSGLEVTARASLFDLSHDADIPRVDGFALVVVLGFAALLQVSFVHPSSDLSGVQVGPCRRIARLLVCLRKCPNALGKGVLMRRSFLPGDAALQQSAR